MQADSFWCFCSQFPEFLSVEVYECGCLIWTYLLWRVNKEEHQSKIHERIIKEIILIIQQKISN